PISPAVTPMSEGDIESPRPCPSAWSMKKASKRRCDVLMSDDKFPEYCHQRGRLSPEVSNAIRTWFRNPDSDVAMTKTHRPWYKVLYLQVLIAIAAGVVIGHFWPDLGKALKPLGDGLISLIKMMIAPVIFCTVVHGIGSMHDLRKVGRVGVKTL